MPLKKLISTSPLREAKRYCYFLAGWLLISLLVLTAHLLLPRPALAQGPSVDTTLDENDGSCSDGDCSLRDAIALAAPSDTIAFDAALAGQTITLTTQLEITKALTIDGSALADPVKINGNNATRVFYITAAATLTHLDIINGQADNGGGLYVQSGVVTVNYSTFSGNTAQTTSGGGGGGLYLTGNGSVTINDSAFSANTTGYAGGGAYNEEGSTLIIHRSTFSGNTALYGGAIGNKGTLRLNNSTLSGNANTSSSYGGSAMDLWGASNDTEINHCTIVSNTATLSSDQSGILLETGVLKLRNSIVAHHNGTYNFRQIGGTFTSQGYNLANAWNGLTIQATDLTGAPLLAALADNGPSTGSGQATLTHALLPGSPALDAANPTVSLTTDQRSITRPQDFDYDGHAISDIGAFEALPPEIFLTKSADPAVGAPYHGVVTYTLVLNNSSADTDPTVFLTDTLPTQVTFARWVENPGASVAGDEITWNGVLTAHTALTFTFQVTHTGDYGETVVNAAHFSGLHSGGQARAGFTVFCPDVFTVQNTANSGPGGLRDAINNVCHGGVVNFAPALAGQVITLTDTIGIDKPLTLDGGGLSAQVKIDGRGATRLFFIQDTAAVTMTQLILTGGYISGYLAYGGAIYNAGVLTLQEMTFTDNQALHQGGAVYSYYGSRLRVSDSEFYRNRASVGGALYVYYDNTVAEVTGSVFMTNTASSSGGAIHNQESTLTITGSLIAGNQSYNGGGLNIYDGVVTLAGCTIANNQADYGAGLSHNYGQLLITNTQILSNTAAEYGGAGSSAEGHLTVAHSVIAGNTSNDLAGGFLFREGIVTISDSTLRDNRSLSRFGGAIYNMLGNSLTITRSTLSGNQAVTTGGGIYNIGSSLTVQASDFISNTAIEGGALYNSNGTLNVTNSAFYSNTATAYGGGIYIYGGTATVNASTLAGNRTTHTAYANGYGGGGLYNYQGTLTVQNSTLANNAASTNSGGGLYNAGGTTIQASTISGNSADYGGGIWSASGYLQLQQTIVANSSAGHDCGTAGGTVDSVDGLFEAAQENACGVSGDYNTVFGVDPLLGPLGDYGGPTPTFALLPNSPAIDAVKLGGCLPTDQRGVARPQGAHCDIGAFELVPPEMAVLGNSQVIANGDTSASAADHTDFGSVTVGGTLTRTFTISNSGGMALSLTGSPVVGLTGAGAGSFNVVVQPTTSISPNATTAFQVRFTASVTGTQVATVTIANNDSDENPYDFAIAGTGDSSIRQVYLPLICR